MSTLNQVMKELKSKGSAQSVKTFARHGAPSNMYGVKVSDVKTILKKIKGDQALAMELFDTGNSDAMYLAGLLADGAQMTKKQIESWVKNASWYMLAEYTVPWVTIENPAARDFALKWIDSKKESTASSGWCTYAGMLATRPDEELNLKEIKDLLKRIEKQIDKAQNRVRYTMNGFVIAVGGYVRPLVKEAKATAKKIGKISVEMGDTACKVPLATEYIDKMESSGRAFKKRKTFKC